jgi:hypothetical protein
MKTFSVSLGAAGHDLGPGDQVAYDENGNLVKAKGKTPIGVVIKNHSGEVQVGLHYTPPASNAFPLWGVDTLQENLDPHYTKTLGQLMSEANKPKPNNPTTPATEGAPCLTYVSGGNQKDVVVFEVPETTMKKQGFMWKVGMFFTKTCKPRIFGSVPDVYGKVTGVTYNIEHDRFVVAGVRVNPDLEVDKPLVAQKKPPLTQDLPKVHVPGIGGLKAYPSYDDFPLAMNTSAGQMLYAIKEGSAWVNTGSVWLQMNITQSTTTAQPVAVPAPEPAPAPTPKRINEQRASRTIRI